MQEKRLIGSALRFGATADDIPHLVTLYQAGKLKLRELVTRTSHSTGSTTRWLRWPLAKVPRIIRCDTVARSGKRHGERSQTEGAIECGPVRADQCRRAGDERGLSVRAAVRQMANVVRRYHDEV